MTSKELFVDISALVHLVERATRELIVVERAQAVRSVFLGGFSGLIIPVSWALSLTIHGKENGAPKSQLPDKLLRCVKDILLQLSREIPGQQFNYYALPFPHYRLIAFPHVRPLESFERAN